MNLLNLIINLNSDESKQYKPITPQYSPKSPNKTESYNQYENKIDVEIEKNKKEEKEETKRKEEIQNLTPSHQPNRLNLEALRSKIIEKKYKPPLSFELIEKYGFPETLSGTNNNIWYGYFQMGILL